jgi:BirA family biotin operon repressor/biotin-[acetyl-CoA-carboxylase] ligase
MGREGLSPASITSGLETQFIGHKVIYYPRLTSTMEVARREARRGAVEGTVVIAGEQTAGKGRLRRVWLSPQGSLALSTILYPRLVYLPSLIMLASLAVVRSIEAVTGLKSQVKWPNDVLINGRKVCGILIESDVRGDTVAYAIIGIGINVNLKLVDFPGILPLATSLSEELGRDVSLLGLIQQLLVEIEGLYLTLPAGGSIYEEWRDSLVTLGKKVRVESGKIRYEGIAESVARDGSLLLRHSNGNLTRIVAGDVTLGD